MTDEATDEAPDLQLLLTDAEEYVPVLESGLSEEELSRAPTPSRGPKGAQSMHLDAPDRDPNDLPAQRWGVIAPEGALGDQQLAAIEALLQHREAQQGAPPKRYRVPPDMGALDALRWKNEVYRAEDVPEDERPRYLLMLGDLDAVSLELQHILANGSLVGRLQCPDLQGFRAYAEKVVARETGALHDRGRALYYTVQDGTAAVDKGHRRLIEPCLEMTRQWSEAGKLELSESIEIPYSDWGPDEMLEEAGGEEPSVMLSLSHGLGAPRRGWKTPDHQRALQGAISMGAEEPLTADALAETAFLPGGIWFAVACFAAGTPSSSAFYPWLSLLAEHGASAQHAKAVLKSLPAAGERPFVAALPQALLANPEGPLAVVGHMDLAWTFGFTDPSSKRSRASRMFSTLRALLAGSRVGVGVDALMRVYRETNDDLMARYQLQREAQSRGLDDPVDPRQLGHLWMQRNDLRGYVLLGDPATRLPVRSSNAAVMATAATAAARPEELRSSPPPAASDSQDTSKQTAPAPSEREPEEVSGRGVDGPTPTVSASESAPDDEPAHAPARAPAPAPAPTQRATSTPALEHAVYAAAPVARAVAQPAPEPYAPPAPRAHAPAAASYAPAVPPSYQAPPMTDPPHNAPQHATIQAPAQTPAASQHGQGGHGGYAAPPPPQHPPPPPGAAPLPAMTRPRSLENPHVALRERAVLALIRGDEAPRSIAVRFGIPLEELFYWLDVYRESGRRVLGG